MFDIYAALSGGMIANLLLTILGLVISVAAGILLYWKVFGPKAKDPSAGKFMQYANGQRFLPLCIVKITYYSLAAFLVFMALRSASPPSTDSALYSSTSSLETSFCAFCLRPFSR